MLEDRFELIDVALGRKIPDTWVRGGSLVNVLTGEILESCNIAISHGRIASVGLSEVQAKDDALILNAEGFYVLPGLIDGHVHIESSMLRPIEFCRATLPHGTTSVLIDPHEITNVLGLDGVRYMLDESEGLPLKFFVQIPSCVPSAPNLETSGASINGKDVALALNWQRVVGLAEVMNFPGVLLKDPNILDEIRITLERGKIVEGHAPGLGLRELNAYASAGVKGDHESISSEEAIMKLRLGMTLEIREGSSAKNLEAIIPSLLAKKIDLRHCLLVTDDKHADEILSEGHVDHLLHQAIFQGVDPVKAIQMVTINVAEHFHLESEIGSISPGRSADLTIVKNLEDPKPAYVFSNGCLVAKDGKLTSKLTPFQCPETVRRSIHLKRQILPSDFEIPVATGSSSLDVLVIGVKDGEAYTHRLVERMRVENGLLVPDLKKDILKVSVIERHKATGNIGLGFVEGFGIKKGAIGSSVGHDSHNIIVLGTNDTDMAHAVSSIARMDGGIVAVKSRRAIARLPLHIAGLMSDQNAHEVVKGLRKIQEAVENLGTTLRSPFMTLSFLPLAVIPHLRITDKGLVDVDKFKTVSLLA